MTTIHFVSLGCPKNRVDTEVMLGVSDQAGCTLVDDPAHAEVIVVNTCGFVDAAKKDSIDTLMAAADTGKKVVAVGCLAERYGDQLAASLPEADRRAVVAQEPDTRTGVDLLAEAAEIREQGYAVVDSGHAMETMAAVAVPVTESGRVVAAVALAAPSEVVEARLPDLVRTLGEWNSTRARTSPDPASGP